jgi:hypothetical protein
MQQEGLFYESLNDAIGDVIKVCGGPKAVAGKLWPEKTPDGAHRLLLACLNEGRVEKLSPEHFMMILRMGRERNCHAAINYICRDTGYSDPTPIEPDDEKARLQREFIAAQRAMSSLATKMEKAGMLHAA